MANRKSNEKWYIGTSSADRLILLPHSKLEELESRYAEYENADEDERAELAYASDGLPAPENYMAEVDFPDCVKEYFEYASNMAGFEWVEADPENAEIIEQRLMAEGYTVIRKASFPDPEVVDS